MNKKYTDPSVPIAIILLQLAKDEHSYYEWKIISGEDAHVQTSGNRAHKRHRFGLDDATIGPIWRREADNIREYTFDKLISEDYSPAFAEESAVKFCFEISKSLELQVRAITDMRNPNGIEI